MVVVCAARFKRLEGDIVDEFRLFNNMECEVVPLISFGGLSPVKEVVVIYHPSRKVRLTEDGDVLHVIFVCHIVDESVTQAGLAHPDRPLHILRPRKPNNTDIVSPILRLFSHSRIAHMKYCYPSLYGMSAMIVLSGFVHKVKEALLLWRISLSHCLVVPETEKEDLRQR